MPLVKGASMMSLGTWKARSSKYQRFLNVSNTFMLIMSTVLITSAAILIRFYHLTKLDFLDWLFYACPMCMLALGLYTFLISVYGFLISNQEHRGLISLVAIFFSIAFIVQLFSVFTALELRNRLDVEVFSRSSPLIDENMRSYSTDPTVKGNWDEMQEDLRCCGGLHYETGFQYWITTFQGQRGINPNLPQGVPDSCCHEVSKGCGQNDRVVNFANTYNERLGIWKDGCLEILNVKLKNEVVLLLIVYSGVSVLLALVELITVVFACSYIAQIGRRRRRDEMFSRAASAAHDDEYLPALTSRETNF